jgi:hypothetical protein
VLTTEVENREVHFVLLLRCSLLRTLSLSHFRPLHKS